MFTRSKAKKKNQQEGKDANNGSSKSNSKDVDPKQTGSKAETSAPVNETDFSQPVPGYESLWQGFNTEARRKVWEDYREKELAKAELEAAAAKFEVKLPFLILFQDGLQIPWEISRQAPKEYINPRLKKITGANTAYASTKGSGTALPKIYYYPENVIEWSQFAEQMKSVSLSWESVSKEEVLDVHELVSKPKDEREMADNWYEAIGALCYSCFNSKLVEFALSPERGVRDESGVKSKPDLTIGIEVGGKFVPKIVLEAKAEDKWPGESQESKHLQSLWQIQPTRSAKYSREQKPMVQLTNHMGVTKTACGILFNGYVAHFCTINSARELVADGPYEMSTPLFWKTLVTFIRYAVDQPPLSVQLSLKAAASGALDDDVDRTGDGENMSVKITGPALPRSFDCENYQPLLNDGKNDRPMVWVRNIEGQDVVVKAVDHEEDPSGFLLSELAHEIDVYDRLHEKGARDFIPEFVISGKLPGGDRSAIVTKFAGDSVEFWKPNDKSEAMEVYNKAVDALSKLHKLGYLHGDVALRNFVLDPKTRKVRVIDLGRAEELDEKTNPGHEVDELKSEFRRSFPRYFE